MASQYETRVIIVGAGPSGLSTAACLKNYSIPYVLLEREDCSASLWKKYSYDRLHLHLAKQFCVLPLKPFPTDYPTFVPRNLFLNYLDDYVSHFSIEPKYERRVESAEYDQVNKMWKVVARNLSSGEILEEYSSTFLVVATGETSDAFIPEVEGLNNFAGEVIHSTKYKNGKAYENKNVLVVGSGNSGMEIALDLSNHGANTSIAIRSPLHFLSKWMIHLGLVWAKHNVPLKVIDAILVTTSKLYYGDLSKTGIQRPEEGPFTIKAKYGKYPLIDCGTCHKIKSGEIQVISGMISKAKGGNEVVFQDGRSYPFDAIVFATGFKRSTNIWLKENNSLLNEDGFPVTSYPNHWKGKNGLYCAGLGKRGLIGAAFDGEKVAHHINTLLHSP